MKTLTRSQGLDLFAEHIPDIEKAVQDNWIYKRSLLKKPNAIDSMLWRVQSWRYVLEEEELRKQFQPTLRLIELRKQPKKEGMITDIDIQRAKEYPIGELLDTKGRKGNVSCPFHEDKNPSLQIKKNNTWTCYSCGEFGDSIDLYMKLNNTDFLTAVKQLV